LLNLNDYLHCFFEELSASVLDPVYGEGVVQDLARKERWYDENWVGTSGGRVTEGHRIAFKQIPLRISRREINEDDKVATTNVIPELCREAVDRCCLPDYVEEMERLLDRAMVSEDDASTLELESDDGTSLGSASDDGETAQVETASTGLSSVLASLQLSLKEYLCGMESVASFAGFGSQNKSNNESSESLLNTPSW
jgi:hypothetical protein